MCSGFMRRLESETIINKWKGWRQVSQGALTCRVTEMVS